MPGKLQPTLIKYPTKYFQPLIYCLSTNCCFHSFPGGKSKFFPQTSLVQNATFRNLKLEISVVTHWDPCCDQQLKLYFEVVFLKLVVEFCVGKKITQNVHHGLCTIHDCFVLFLLNFGSSVFFSSCFVTYFSASCCFCGSVIVSLNVSTVISCFSFKLSSSCGQDTSK